MKQNSIFILFYYSNVKFWLTIRQHACFPSMKPFGMALAARISYLQTSTTFNELDEATLKINSFLISDLNGKFSFCFVSVSMRIMSVHCPPVVTMRNYNTTLMWLKNTNYFTFCNPAANYIYKKVMFISGELTTWCQEFHTV